MLLQESKESHIRGKFRNGTDLQPSVGTIDVIAKQFARINLIPPTEEIQKRNGQEKNRMPTREKAVTPVEHFYPFCDLHSIEGHPLTSNETKIILP